VTAPDGWSERDIGVAPLPPLNSLDGTTSKHDRGTVVVIAGEPGCPGAALLSGTAALRCGAGRVQIVTHDAHAVAVAGALPEALVLGSAPRNGEWQLDDAAADLVRDAEVVLVGPGLSAAGPNLARAVLREAPPRTTVVLDAGALAGVESKPLREGCVLLPNPREVSMVIDRHVDRGDDRTEVGQAAIELAEITGAVAAVRGAVTAIADPRARVLHVLDDPRPGLAVAGSGDVLAGAVAAFCTRTDDKSVGVAWGVAIHHEAGNNLECQIGPVGFLAREIVDVLPNAMRAVASRRPPS
jgi:ADP-dependent NAD(P)H-hydrate dehydratase